MKKLILLFVFLPIISSAQVPLERNWDGDYQVAKTIDSSNVVAEEAALKYIEMFSWAVNSPGELISVERNERILKLKPVFKKLVEIEEFFIVYDSASEKISYLETKKEKEERSYLILFSIASLILMIISNIFYKKEEEIFSFFSLLSLLFFMIPTVSVLNNFVFAGLVIITVFTVLVTVFLAASASASVTIYASVTISNGKSGKAYKAMIWVYYILMAAHFILLFL